MKDAATFREEKRLEFNLQQQHERDRAASSASRRKSTRIKKILKTPPHLRGKIATRNRAEDITSDYFIALAISDIFQGGGGVRLRAELRPGVQYYGVNKSLIKTHDKLSKIIVPIDEITDIYTPRWKDTGDFLKTLGWMIGSIKHFGLRARAFTLNLSNEVIVRASCNKDGFASYIQKALKRNLSRAYAKLGISTPPDFFFWVEAHSISRPHLHGVIIMPSVSVAADSYKLIRKAIRASGGDWTGPGHQLVIKSFKPSNPYGWGWYISKLKETSETNLRNVIDSGKVKGLVGVTSNLNRISKAAYEEARQRGEILPGP